LRNAYVRRECGTPEFIAVEVGSLNDPSIVKPKGHIWRRSAQLWHVISPALREKDPEQYCKPEDARATHPVSTAGQRESFPA
jgi:hypothetical protein